MKTGSKMTSELEGLSLIGGTTGSKTNETFRAFDPRTGDEISPDFYTATVEEVERAASLANTAASSYGRVDIKIKAAFIDSIAENLESIRAEIIARASLETGLPEARFEGELGRTCGQLRMFADVVREGSWVDARIDRAQPGRVPLAKPDVRSMLRPIGPVAVFCASNFPLAFSVAGGDTASALASGNPVIVIGHTAHPGTAELAGKAIAKAVSDNGLHEGVFSLIFSKGYHAGQTLVKHAMIRAVGFTGSRTGGKALMNLAAARKEPIPVFAEMSSVNPLFVLPKALEARHDEIAEGLFASFTLGYGQFCTKPGIVVLPESDAANAFLSKIESLVGDSGEVPLLSPGIRDSYVEKSGARGIDSACGSAGFGVNTSFHTVAAEEFLSNPVLSDEIFGPTALFVFAHSARDFLRIAESLEGQLTCTLHGTDEELSANSALLSILETKAGRLVFNAFPTGVEVCGAMVHGGPFPATSDARSTSVGKRAIERFTRLTAYQGFTDETLPPELQDDNPLNINRIEE